ncbi:MAG: hypothetical protein MUC43_05290 [Pirellula sp.]|jgi:hypothetical protein|nr:hypothetical protein [Pirellula sp.]
MESTDQSPERLERRDKSLPRPVNPKWSDGRAWMISCVIHFFLFTTIMVLWRPITRGTGGEQDRPVGIAVVHQTNSGTEYFLSGSEGGPSNANNSDSSAAAIPSSVMPDSQGAAALESLLSDLAPNDSKNNASGAGTDTSDTGLSGVGNSAGPGKSTGKFGAGDKTKTSFLGVEGAGTSFVYVLDRSDSMNVNSSAPMSVAKRELSNSIDSLSEDNQFQIVFYNEAPIPLSSIRGVSNRMHFAKEADKKRAKQFIRAMIANGGTEHLSALRMGLSFGPDVLFFMTDADEPRLIDAQLQDLQERALRTQTTIHTIEFRAGPQTGNGGWIRSLAEMTKGTYRYVDVETLQPE